MTYRLFASKECGSAVIEAALTITGAAWALEELEFEPSAFKSEAFLRVNPLGQVPALVLPDGAVITESAAILLTLADRFPDAGLAPPAGSDARATFNRWLVYLAVNVYGEIIRGDFPARYVADPAGHAGFTACTDAVARERFQVMETALSPAPFLLGAAMTALDPYLAMIRRWRPAKGWFAEACPKLEGAARAAEAHPAVKAAWARQGWE